MAFSKADSRVPTSIGAITLTLLDDPNYVDEETGITGQKYVANYDIEVLDQNGRRMRVPFDNGDLIPQLSSTEQSSLLALAQSLRTKADVLITG